MTAKKKENDAKTDSNHTQIAYEGIKRILFTNEISPGQKISYRQLAEHLGMSLTPVIQALKRLEFQGLVRYEPNKGYSTEPMSMQEVQEIYDMRELIETSLLPEVINNLNEEGIKKLQTLLKSRDKSNEESYLSERLLNDRKFHLALAALSGRKIQVQMLQHLFDLLYLKYGGSLLFIQSKDPVGSQHQKIFNAVVSHDVEEASRALKEHFTKIKFQALKALGKMVAEK
ncbi:MAG: GntR family transcriptional regulator [Desulfobacteraceae bacterium]|nr:GntR family transcriptional regulator [Desulfobacteraceae bacterium]